MLDTGIRAALVVFARYPSAGEVKTRLASAIGDGAAVELYHAFLADIGRRLRTNARWTLHWAFEPAGSPFVAEIAGGSPAFPQAKGHLGERMAAALAQVFAWGFRPAVLIGSDIPHLPRERLDEAFALLEEGSELVLGPADDGGYYLIGSRASVPPVFDGIEWGTSRVLRQTLAAAARAVIVPRLLGAEYDVDDARDLERLRGEIAAGARGDLPSTQGVLERLPALGYK